MITCPRCSTDLADGTKFCTNCGAAMEPANVDFAAATEVTCANCGGPLGPAAVVCPNCGQAVHAVVATTETAAAQAPAVEDLPEERSAVAAASAESTATEPVYPLSTSQGYRCPVCHAFIKPESTFCANCGAAFAEAVPYGGLIPRQLNPAIPVAAALVLLTVAAFAGWYFLSDRPDETRIAGGRDATIVSQPDTSIRSANTMTTRVEVEETRRVARTVFDTFWIDCDLPTLYSIAYIDPDFQSTFPTGDSFAAGFEANSQMNSTAVRLLGNSIRDIEVGQPVISGDRAEVRVDFTLDDRGQTIHPSALIRLIKREGSWKLDLSGQQGQVQTRLLEATGLTSIQSELNRVPPQDAGGISQPAPPPTTGGGSGASTGDFQYTTGTTGMGG